MASGLSDLLNLPTSTTRTAPPRATQRAANEGARENASFTLPEQPAPSNARQPQSANRQAAPANDPRPASYESMPAPTEPPTPAKPASWSYQAGDTSVDAEQASDGGEASYTAPTTTDAAAQLAAAAAAAIAPTAAPPQPTAPVTPEEMIGDMGSEGDADAQAQALLTAAALELEVATADGIADDGAPGAALVPAAAAAAAAAAAQVAAVPAQQASEAPTVMAAVGAMATAGDMAPKVAQTIAAVLDMTRAAADGAEDMATAEQMADGPVDSDAAPASAIPSAKTSTSGSPALLDAIEALGRSGAFGQTEATEDQAALPSASPETPASPPTGEAKTAAVPVEAKALASFEAPRGADGGQRIETSLTERSEPNAPQSGSGVVSQTGESFVADLEAAKNAQIAQAATPKTPLGAVPIELGMRAMAGVNRFEIRLDPPELGRIDVRLDIDDDGAVRAHLSVDRVETLALLQRDARTLERAFEQAGLKAAEGSVDLTLRDPAGQDRNGQDRTGDEGRHRGARPSIDDGPSGMNDPIPTRNYLWRGANGVDVRV